MKAVSRRKNDDKSSKSDVFFLKYLIKSGGVLTDWEMIWSTGDMAPHFLQRAFVFHEKITIYFLPTFESKGFKHIR